jgi:hypothetical protein
MDGIGGKNIKKNTKPSAQVLMSERRLGIKDRRKAHTYRKDERRSSISNRRISPTDSSRGRRHVIKDRRTKSVSIANSKRSGITDRRKSSKKKNIYEVAESGINIIKAGLALFLLPRCEADFDKDYAGFLVAAVVNAVFYESPSNQVGRQFIQDNDNLNNIKLLIEEEMGPEEMLRQIITDAVRVKVFLVDDMIPKQSIMDTLRYCIDPIDHLNRLGLLIPERGVPDINEFMNNAAAFLQTCREHYMYEKSH